ncbi:MAG TPA: hypothetical protein VMI52_10385 [Acetobacteraceae bacterium]|nr:hypothetical protein [Acetobacteraceae bacterium]
MSSHDIRVHRSPKGAGRTAIAAAILFLGVVGCPIQQSAGEEVASDSGKKPPSGTVEMSQLQAAFIGSGSGGTGTLHFRGRSYRFKVGGLGVGGIGVSSIKARGEVYNLNKISQFPGTYIQGRYGFAVGRASAGGLWLKNSSGVILNLKAKRTGLMLSLGGDAVVISMSH